MIISKYDPLKKQQFQVLDADGNIVNPKDEPNIDDKTLINMYKTMKLARHADIKALQYQRQGRMLTYAPVQGQEAAQIGPMAALEPKDWLAPAFREFAAMLYRGATLEQLYLYWYGNEIGSKFADGVNILPINIPIGSQINHAVGLAYASKIQNKNQVVVTYIGDGGTSHGEFYEGMNFAAVLNAPMIAIIQNNQYAISTPRAKATRAETLAQKALAFGIPGIQVDGNDVLAMYAIVKEAAERARKGEGPTLIEAFTYRLGPHTTSDDPTIYRKDEEVEEWKKKDPIKRFKTYLINKKLWSDEQDRELDEQYEQLITETFKRVENSDNPTIDEVFDYTFVNIPQDLIDQKEKYMKYLKRAFLSSLKETSRANQSLKEK
ncbi:MAG TPA: pyruvate dehydrogenase (acetyl-transferring) E1 component subunit alpha [Firmicutes bacterium]|nr:pyruvate dehydrogenase (acetyl-transferring) E1 component subunit alpha [Bacillota bacterium]